MANRPTLIDALFDAEVRFGSVDGEFDALEAVRLGGLPQLALEPSSEAQRSRDIALDTDAILTENVLPGERFDSGVARRLLELMLCTSASVFNATSTGRHLGLDRRTVARYIDVLERRFLIRTLPNLATNPRSEGRPKVHAVDSALVVDALARRGTNIANDRSVFGLVLETYVAQQLRAAVGWSEAQRNMFYWRDVKLGDAEVDVVIQDGSGRLVHIEVKAAATVGPKDTKGLRQLQNKLGLHRGFILYNGKRVERLADNLFALPLHTLRDHSLTFVE